MLIGGRFSILSIVSMRRIKVLLTCLLPRRGAPLVHAVADNRNIIGWWDIRRNAFTTNSLF